MMELDISTLDNGIRLAKLSGKMDIQGVNQVGEELASKIGSAGIATIIDLSEVSFIASLGMRSLMTTARGVTNHGGKLVLENNADSGASSTLVFRKNQDQNAKIDTSAEDKDISPKDKIRIVHGA